MIKSGIGSKFCFDSSQLSGNTNDLTTCVKEWEGLSQVALATRIKLSTSLQLLLIRKPYYQTSLYNINSVKNLGNLTHPQGPNTIKRSTGQQEQKIEVACSPRIGREKIMPSYEIGQADQSSTGQKVWLLGKSCRFTGGE